MDAQSSHNNKTTNVKKPTNYNYASTDNGRSVHTDQTAPLSSPRTLTLGSNEQGKGLNKTKRGVFTSASVVAGTAQKVSISSSLVLPIGIETPVSDALIETLASAHVDAMFGAAATSGLKAIFVDSLKQVIRGNTVLPDVDNYVAPEGE